MENPWKVTLLILRQKRSEGPEVLSRPHFDRFEMEVNPEEYLLDAIERVWAFHDRSLCFAHACHHSTCGACGMRVDGKEKLACITTLSSLTEYGGTLKIEPLRNFPVVSDLVVDMGGLFRNMQQVGHRPVNSSVVEPLVSRLSRPEKNAQAGDFTRLSDCIECGLCVSVCPSAATDTDYLGPAALAGAHQRSLAEKGALDKSLLRIVDNEAGLWRCHSAFECSAVCPSNVDPAGRIMALRSRVLNARLKNWFGVK
jgi:succinate dehydrogenase / fumarate reductase, iron-sulfur subunit